MQINLKLNNTRSLSTYFDNELIINNIPSLDWQLSLKLAAGKSKLAKNLFQIMITSLPNGKKLINAAFQENNLQNLHECVHKLHGGCCYTGFSRLKYISKQLEQEIIFKNHNKIAEYIAVINQEIDFLIFNYNQS
jgi:two-component system sensor histidine kinase BarA